MTNLPTVDVAALNANLTSVFTSISETLREIKSEKEALAEAIDKLDDQANCLDALQDELSVSDNWDLPEYYKQISAQCEKIQPCFIDILAVIREPLLAAKHSSRWKLFIIKISSILFTADFLCNNQFATPEYIFSKILPKSLLLQHSPNVPSEEDILAQSSSTIKTKTEASTSISSLGFDPSKARPTDFISNIPGFVTIEMYLLGIADSCKTLSRLSTVAVGRGHLNFPFRVLPFIQTIFLSFKRLNFKNDSLRRSFDSLKYTIQHVEGITYDIKIRNKMSKT